MSELTQAPFDTREDNPMPIACPLCGWETPVDNLSPNAQALWTCVRSVLRERDRQDGKWGVQNHDDFKWLAILAEEHGELAEQILHTNDKNMRKELVQVIAVGLAWLEHVERRRNALMRQTYSERIEGDPRTGPGKNALEID